MAKKVTKVIVLTIVWFLASICIYKAAFGEVTRVKINGKVFSDNIFQVFYTNSPNAIFRGDTVSNIKIKGSNDFQKIYTEIPEENIEKLRIDFGSNPGLILIKDITIEQAYKKVRLTPAEIKKVFSNVSEDVEINEVKDNLLQLYATKLDPLIYSNDIGNILTKQPYDIFKLLIIFALSILLSASTIKVYNNLVRRNISIEKWTFAAVFVVIVSLPGIINLLGIQSGKSTEQRVLAEKPKFRINKDLIGKYPKDYEAYMNDNFGMKSFLVWLNSYIDVKLLKTSPMDRVALGKEGWLYTAKEDNLDMLEIYRGLHLFSQEELEKIKNNLQERKNWLSKQNIPFVLMIAPNKETVYPEYLPDNIKKVQEETRLDQLVTYLRKNTDINIIDAREELLNKKNTERLYYKTDSHWNELGAYYGQRLIMNEVNKYLPNVKSKELSDFDIKRETKNEGGDLAKMLGMTNNFKEEHIYLEPKDGKKYTVVEHPYILTQGLVTENEDKSLPRLLMFRDSFTVNLQPFISEYFSTAVYQWNHSFDANLVIQTKPDIVVHEIVERYIHELLVENPKEMK